MIVKNMYSMILRMCVLGVLGLRGEYLSNFMKSRVFNACNVSNKLTLHKFLIAHVKKFKIKILY